MDSEYENKSLLPNVSRYFNYYKYGLYNDLGHTFGECNRKSIIYSIVE